MHSEIRLVFVVFVLFIVGGEENMHSEVRLVFYVKFKTQNQLYPTSFLTSVFLVNHRSLFFIDIPTILAEKIQTLVI